VILDPLHRDAQLQADCFIAEALCHQLDNPHFLRGKFHGSSPAVAALFDRQIVAAGLSRQISNIFRTIMAG
jgi:hypothetical protein